MTFTKTAKTKPAKVSMEDVELANEIGLVTAIKEAIGTFSYLLEEEFNLIEGQSEAGTPVATYKQIVSSRESLREALNNLQANLLVGLGDIEPDDAKELSTPSETAGTMDAALESTEPTVEIHSEEK